MTAIESSLTGLFDYAGLYPPASLSMRSAVNNYLDYSRSKHAWALGRFIVNFDRLEELRELAGDSFPQLRLSVIAADSDLTEMTGKVREFPFEAIEMKCGEGSEVGRIAALAPSGVSVFFEIGRGEAGLQALKAIAESGNRAKIRMGGVVPDALPPVSEVVQTLKALADLRLPFKATAGLHHPVRSRRNLTYKEQSPHGIMHGFMNLMCGTCLLHFGGSSNDAERLIAEQDASAWRVSAESIHWRDRSWTVEQLREMRSRFLISIGSCSFEEPIHDLESLGWL